ncbi:MAG: potassium-transporting ATPase subunit KdpA [Burkholderiales bacterium]|nr:potassium-transporting ATPase subunit KdpA [Burkholderiales bacterium]
MTPSAWGLLALVLGLVLLLAWPVGRWMAALLEGRLPAWMRRIEAPLYSLAGTDPERSMPWTRYAFALLAFNAVGALFVYGLQRLQQWLPLNPAKMAAVSPDSSFNTALSFATNTNWQGYGGESTLGYLVQMIALAAQNFFSAATGIAVAFALIRGFAQRSAAGVGNFWADLVRSTLWLLLPLCIVVALFQVSQGSIQNVSPYQELTTLEARPQTLAMGPVASQEAIKMVGTNGGGFFNANSAHPYENPNAWTNLVQMLAILIIPAGLCFTFGRGVGDLRQGWAVLAAMTVLLVAMVVVVIPAEQAGNPHLAALGVDTSLTADQPGGNMEGKEARFGIESSGLFAAITTAASCGAVNGMHDSYTPLGGMVPLVLMQLGEVVFGGVGSGLYGMLIFAILAVFIAGLMIGRTPEYLGKKIEAYEMKLTSVAILVTPIVALAGTAIAVIADAGKAGVANPGAHGFSEILYAFTSAANNNGSAFAGLSANTPFYNTMLGIAVWLGRFGVIVPVLAIAGALAAKKRLPVTAGTMPTHGPLFVALLVGTVLLVGLLNFVPALALGPAVEHLMLWGGR